MTGQMIVYLTSDDVRIILPGQRLAINAEEQIVTLFSPGADAILAQGQFPPSAFRAFIVLLKSPRGASYAELLAGLNCSEEVIKQLLAARTTDEVSEFHTLAYHWQKHLVAATAEVERDRFALERELKPIRWAVKLQRGVQSIARDKGFGWRVRVMPRKGYVLLRASTPPAEARPPAHVSLTGSSTSQQ
jgi:hypothetical protein